MTILTRRFRRAIRVRLIGLSRLIGRPVTATAGAPWKLVNPVELAHDLGAIVLDPDRALRNWIERNPASATYLHPVNPEPPPAFREKTRALMAGEFRANATVPTRNEHLPPAWHQRADSGRTEEVFRHAMVWLEPLVSVAFDDDDDQLWDVATQVIKSWIEANSKAPGCSRGAWHDHAVSFRVRIFCWFLELYRRRPSADESFIRLLVASIYQHGVFLADQNTHDPRSNHALEAAGSLFAICVSLPDLRTSSAWFSLASQRTERYVAQAFGEDGFSKEQSPCYHFFILQRLTALTSFLQAVDHPVPVGLQARLLDAAEVWPWLLRDDESVPRIGDSGQSTIPGWRRWLPRIDASPPAPAPSTQLNPRGDGAAMLASRGGLYAILRGSHPSEITLHQIDDAHIVFKTNYFTFPHFHHDGLSFVFYALGREWLIDPGPHSYEYHRWERKYLCSSTAHNTVEVEAPFGVHPVEFVSATRTGTSDQVTVRHHLDNAVHTRTLEYRPPRRLRIVDEITVTDGRQHAIRQLFQVHPDCAVEQHPDGALDLLDPTGQHCLIRQKHPGTWRIVRGQREPEPLGWYSPQALMIHPISTCVYQVHSSGTVRFETTIEAFPVTAPVAATMSGQSGS